MLEADNARAALDLLRDNGVVDLALIDLVMPGVNGRQLAMRIRASDPEQKILFMTGYDDLSGTDDPFAKEMLLKNHSSWSNSPWQWSMRSARINREQPLGT